MFRDVEIRMRTAILFERKLPELPAKATLTDANKDAMNVTVRSGCVVVDDGDRDHFAVQLPGGMYAKFVYDDEKQMARVQIDE